MSEADVLGSNHEARRWPISDPGYVLGHSDRELERLSAQERLIGPATRQFFRDAGVGPGMRVLDVGSGAGDSAFAAAELVGETSEVIGVDRAPAAVEAATKRAKVKELRNVSFHLGDPMDMAFDEQFDAIVGRYFLLFQPDPAVAVRKLVRHLRPHGLIVFHEPTWDFARSNPPAPLYDRCCRWIDNAFHAAGTGTMNMPGRLFTAFVDAGLPAPSMRMQTFVGGPEAASDLLRAMADMIGILLPAMERLGVASAKEVQSATLFEQLVQELSSTGGVIIGRAEIGAWSRTIGSRSV